MNCRDFVRSIYAQPLRQRSEGAMRRLNEHVARCPSCARRLVDARQVERSLETLVHVRPPTNMVHRVMARATATKPATPIARHRFGEAVGWAAGVVGMMSLAAAYLLATPATGWLARLGLHPVRSIASAGDILGPLAGGPALATFLAMAGALLVIVGFVARGRGVAS